MALWIEELLIILVLLPAFICVGTSHPTSKISEMCTKSETFSSKRLKLRHDAGKLMFEGM